MKPIKLAAKISRKKHIPSFSANLFSLRFEIFNMDTGVIFSFVFSFHTVKKSKYLDGVSIHAKHIFSMKIKNTGVGGGIQLHYCFSA